MIPSVPFRIKIVESSLPEGTAMTSVAHLYESAEDEFVWYLAEIDRCEVAEPAMFKTENLPIRIYDSRNVKLASSGNCRATGTTLTRAQTKTALEMTVQYAIEVNGQDYTEQKTFNLSSLSEEQRYKLAYCYGLINENEYREAAGTETACCNIISDNLAERENEQLRVTHPLSTVDTYTYTNRQYVISAGGRYRIYYESGSGTYSLTQTRAQTIANRMDAIDTHFTGLGFSQPLLSTGASYVNVYIVPTSSGATDSCAVDEQLTSTTCSAYIILKVSNWCSFSNDLFSTMAHEYMHAVTHGYRCTISDSTRWYIEGMGVWAGIAYIKSLSNSASTSYASGYVDVYISSEASSIRSSDISFCYGSFLLPLYIQQARGSITTVKNCLNQWRTYIDPLYAVHYGLYVTNTSYSLTTTFAGMCAYNYRPSYFYYYADSSWADFNDAAYGTIITSDASGSGSTLPMMSFEYTRIEPTISSGSCQIDVNYTTSGIGTFKVVRETNSGTYNVLAMSDGANPPDYTLTISGIGTSATTKALTLVAVNATRGTTATMTYSYSVDIN